eukprot:m.54795 g.54795  ORF g.54795 m.54795 type:complete len:59 (-) comp11091_c0_seq2:199-375(-)
MSQASFILTTITTVQAGRGVKERRGEERGAEEICPDSRSVLRVVKNKTLQQQQWKQSV